MLIKSHCKLYALRYEFSPKVVNVWDKMAGRCVNATSIKQFKSIIDKCFQDADFAFIL